MKKNIYIKIIIFLTITLIIFAFIPKSIATVIFPGAITGNPKEMDDIDKAFEDSKIKNIENLIRYIGIFIAVGALMIMGIKYMAGSVEEKAEYKKSMIPYIIGCFLLFEASVIAPNILDLFKDTDEETMGNTILGTIRYIGSFIAVGAIMVLGIKYMLGSTEERAEYKKTMLPYFIGGIILFGAVNLIGVVASMSDSVQPEEDIEEPIEEEP